MITTFKRTKQDVIDQEAQLQSIVSVKKSRQLLSTAAVDDLVKHITMGLPFDSACRIVQLRPKTIRSWLEMGCRENIQREAYFKEHGIYPAAESEYHMLYQRVETAFALFESYHLNNIAQAGFAGDWKASEALLKLRMPHKYNTAIQQHNHMKEATGSSNINHIFIHHQEAKSEEEWKRSVDGNDYKAVVSAAKDKVQEEKSDDKDFDIEVIK